MPTLNAARESIYLRMQTEWAAAGQSEPVTHDNQAYDPPAGPWLRLTVRHASSAQSTLGAVGNRKFRRRGLILIQVFDLVNQGTRSVDLLAQTARNIFEGVSFSGVDCFDTNPSEIAPDGRYYGMLLATDFEYDEIK